MILVGCWRCFFLSGGPFPNVERNRSIATIRACSRCIWLMVSLGRIGHCCNNWINHQSWHRLRVLNPHSGGIFQRDFLSVANNNVTYRQSPSTRVADASWHSLWWGGPLSERCLYRYGRENWCRNDPCGRRRWWAQTTASTGYNPQSAYGSRPRWGDFGAAVSDGTFLWIASEYIGQTCTLSEYLATGFTCGATRTSLANRGTRISQLVP